MGSMKAAVLPDPVCAQAIRSRPFMMMGMAYRWMGVGFVYFDLRTFVITSSRSPDFSKLSTGDGGFSPDTRTSMSSNFSKFMPELMPDPKISASSSVGNGGMIVAGIGRPAVTVAIPIVSSSVPFTTETAIPTTTTTAASTTTASSTTAPTTGSATVTVFIAILVAFKSII
uniref:Uncharacterized protein n=1 Tax=Anopheles culicifacies TaxID=139723 RepID=A0A182MEF7_9DIPT